MSEAALRGTAFDAAVRIEEITPPGMIGFRGDLGDPWVLAVLEEIAGVSLPKQRGIAEDGVRAVAWMAPDEILMLLPNAEVAKAIAELEKRLAGRHHLASDVSDARAMFRVSGPAARDLLAKLSPVDFSPSSLGPGELRRTRVAQVAAALWQGEDGAFTLICFRSVRSYVLDLLMLSAQGGAELDLYKA